MKRKFNLSTLIITCFTIDLSLTRSITITRIPDRFRQAAISCCHLAIGCHGPGDMALHTAHCTLHTALHSAECRGCAPVPPCYLWMTLGPIRYLSPAGDTWHLHQIATNIGLVFPPIFDWFDTRPIFGHIVTSICREFSHCSFVCAKLRRQLCI